MSKSVLITDCSEGGIGDALAQSFHGKGLQVFATARDISKIQHLKQLNVEIFPLDVTNGKSIKNAVDIINSKTGGTLDFLVNNAGAGYAMPLLDLDLPTAQKTFNLNVFAVIEVTKAFSPLLIASKGTIINIGSNAGISSSLWQSYYNASKAATNMLKAELSPSHVKVILLIAGSVKNEVFR